jgi:hypothetical protein
MRVFIHRSQQRTSSNIKHSSTVTHLAGRQVHPILHLQRTIGNQAVQRLLRQAEPDDLGARSSTKEVTRFAHDFSQIPVHPKSPANAQAKLRISPPGDIYEQEEDSVSEQVMRMPDLQLQRACACGGKSEEGECDACKPSRNARGESAGVAHVSGMVGEVLRSAGRPLDEARQTSMDARFHFDFSRVRIHDDARAAESASAVSALAYTVGRHVVFGRGQYSPATAAGRRLLAHELTHVMQQSASGSTTAQPFTIGPAHSPAEREADAIADAVTAHAPISPISGTYGARLYRKRLPDTDENEHILDLGSAKALACCDDNACVDDTGGFDCSNFDCPKETGDKTAQNNSSKQPGHKFSPHLKCDSKCGKDFKPTYSGKELVVAMPSGRRKKGKNQCGQTLGLCANGTSVEVTIREFSNHDIWEVSPGVADKLGVNPDFHGSIYPTANDPDMKDDRNCTPKPKPSPQKPKATPKKAAGEEK